MSRIESRYTNENPDNFILSGGGATPFDGATGPAVETFAGADHIVLTLPNIGAPDPGGLWEFALPRYYKAGSVINARVHWITSTVGVGSIKLDFLAVSIGSGDGANPTFGPVATLTHASNGADLWNITPLSPDITIGNSPSPGDAFKLLVRRDGDAGADTLAGDAKLALVVVEYSKE